MKRIDPDRYELSSGRKFYANNGCIGIDPDSTGNGDSVGEGADDSIRVRGYDWESPSEFDWTVAERHELADFMIDLWTKWKQAQE